MFGPAWKFRFGWMPLVGGLRWNEPLGAKPGFCGEEDPEKRPLMNPVRLVLPPRLPNIPTRRSMPL